MRLGDNSRLSTRKTRLSAAPNKDYFCPMIAVETPKTAGSIPQVWPLSVNAYHVLGDLGLVPEKTELLYGQVFYKMPKSPFHRLLLMRLLELLQRALPPGLHVQPEQPILCGDSEPEPDLSVIRGSINDYVAEHPRTAELVIEICVSSREYDRLKLRAYASAGVKECWLVLAPEKKIEVHRQPAGELFAECAVHGPGGSLTSTSIPSFAVDLATLFAA
jgi:Uma2 family endonuclease